MFRDINTLIAKVETIVNRAHDFRKAYFFTPPSSAYSRRQYEHANSCPVIRYANTPENMAAEMLSFANAEI